MQMRRTMTLLTCSTSLWRYFLGVVLCVWATSAQTHTLGHSSAYPPVESLTDVKSRLIAYRATGDDQVLKSVSTYFNSNLAPDSEADAPLTQEGRLLRAWHAQAMHQFNEASELLAPLLTNSHHAPWLLEANLRRIRGNHAASEQACRQVASNHPLLGQVCLLQTRAHSGRLMDASHPRAVEKLFAVVHARQPVGKEQHAWIMGVLSDAYLAVSNLKESLEWSEKAFRISDSVQYRATCAARLIDNGFLDEALALLDASAEAPALVILRLVALEQLGRLDEALETVRAVDQQFRHDVAHGDFLHAREMARFYLDVLPDPALADRLIMENWEQQKELEDRVLLARSGGLL